MGVRESGGGRSSGGGGYSGSGGGKVRAVPRGGRPHRVAVLVRDGMLPIEVGIVHRIFGEARSAGGEPLYELVTCALEPGEVRTDTDFTVNVAHGPEALEAAAPWSCRRPGRITGRITGGERAEARGG